MHMFSKQTGCALSALLMLSTQAVSAIELDLSSSGKHNTYTSSRCNAKCLADSIKAAAKTAAEGMTQYYTGYRPGDVPGNLPQPYYWWEAGAMFGALVDYWYFTGDDTYNEITAGTSRPSWTQQRLHAPKSNEDRRQR